MTGRSEALTAKNNSCRSSWRPRPGEHFIGTIANLGNDLVGILDMRVWRHLETGASAAIVGALGITKSIDGEHGGIAAISELSREPWSTSNLKAVPQAPIERTAVKK
jgi:hypothetical protein